MAVEAGCPPRSAQFVGMTFVERYYNNFYQFPEHAHKFYQDFSVLSRPGPNGEMTSVTTMQGINDAILSFGSKNFKTEILTTDAQFSHKEGVIVLVTGCLTGKDNARRKFTQSFFLAPQDKGYFVLNDVFRYIDDEKFVRVGTVLDNGVHESAPAAHLTLNPEPNHAPDQPIPDQVAPVQEATKNKKEVFDQLDSKSATLITKEDIPRAQLDSRQNGVVRSVTESASSNVRADSPKKTYASIVMKVMKDATDIAPVHLPAKNVRVKPATEQKLNGYSTPEASAHVNSSTPKSTHDRPLPEVKSYCVHIRNLPLSANVEHVERIFKKYGPIKQGGIQVRSYKNEETCFAFVDFETTTDMKKAIKASPINVDGGREVSVEEKKTFYRGSNGRDRNPSRRDGFRNDQIRDRENFVGRRGNGRNEVRNQESSGRARGHIEIDEDGFQRVYQNRSGRVAC